MAPLRRLVQRIRETLGQRHALLARDFHHHAAPAPRDAIPAPFADCLAIRRVGEQGVHCRGHCILAAKRVYEGVVWMGHDGGQYGIIFPIVKMENIAGDFSGPRGQYFRMDRPQYSDAKGTMIRFQAVRLAISELRNLKNEKRPAFARWLAGPKAKEEEIKGFVDNIRKTEDGDQRPQDWLLDWIAEKAGEPGIPEYVKKDNEGRLTGEFLPIVHRKRALLER